MSLADELLNDLDDLEGDEDEEVDEGDEEEAVSGTGDGDSGGASADHTAAREGSIGRIAKLTSSTKYRNIVRDIDQLLLQEERQEISGPVEVDPEYQVMVRANNIASEVENELFTIHRFARDLYTDRFPELESVVVNPLDYMRTVRCLGNELNVTSKELETILPGSLLMAINVTASTTKARPLSADKMELVKEACDMALQLDADRTKMDAYVASRINLMAPNVAAIVGPPIAAKLVGLAGSVEKLSLIPACNIHLLGKAKKVLAGFSSASSHLHEGIVFGCDVVQSVPSELRVKAGRMLAGKIALAARIDAQHQSRDGKCGLEFRNDIIGKLDKLQEAAPQRTQKALPAPDEIKPKKRAGRKIRKQKEKYQETELRKQQNRLTFGPSEAGDDSDILGETMGPGRGGGVRGVQVEARTKVKLTAKQQRQLQKQQLTQGIFGSAVSGTASSVAFTPMQGLEIYNPAVAQAEKKETTDKYFGAQSSFMKVKTPMPK